MKRIFILLLTILPLISSTARAEKDRPITFEQLPQKAQQFIQKYFAEEKIAFAKSERDFFEMDYLVVFTSGKKIEFLRSGDWEKVDCRRRSDRTDSCPDHKQDQRTLSGSNRYRYRSGQIRYRDQTQ